MCLVKAPSVAAPILAAPDNREAIAQGDLEARLRRRRAGAAAHVLTGPMGIPSGQGTTAQLGGVAA